MGCWNATCNISNLPIYAGDEIVLIPLIQTTKNAEFNVCYPTDNFVPYAFPIFGQYDDYGGIEKIQTTPENQKLILSYNFYAAGKDECGENYVQLDVLKDFEHFFCEELCVCGGHYIKTGCSNHRDGMAEINYFMAHREVYELLIKEAGNRIPYGKDKTYAELLKERYMKAVEKYRAHAEQCLSDVFLDFEIDMLTDTIFCAAETLSPAKRWWKIMAGEYIKTGNETIIDDAVNKTLFNLALSMLRKGYLCDSGVGSQSQETKMHYIVAQFVIKHIAEYAEKTKEDCDEEYWPDVTGVEETIFF